MRERERERWRESKREGGRERERVCVWCCSRCDTMMTGSPCLGVCVCVHACACVRACVCVRVHACVCPCACVCMHVCVCVCVCVCVRVRVCQCTCCVPASVRAYSRMCVTEFFVFFFLAARASSAPQLSVRWKMSGMHAKKSPVNEPYYAQKRPTDISILQLRLLSVFA